MNHQQHQPSFRRAGSDAPRHVLVVDDDVHLRNLNAQVLIRSGFHVEAAEDGAMAWDALRADTYDLVITDHTMPNVSGVELLKKLRGARMTVPVILATGTVPVEEFIQYPWLQPAAMLLKPYTVAELLGMVQELLRVTDVAVAQQAPLQARQNRSSIEGSRL